MTPTPTTSTVRTGREALNLVLRQELEHSADVLLLGETVRHIGAAGVTVGLYEALGPAKVIETPVSENGIMGAALGLALDGFVPVVEIYSADFLLAVANEVIGDIPKWRQQHGQAATMPLTIRACMGANGGLGPEHSQSMEPYFHHAPGLTVVTPGTVADLAGLLRASIRSPGPVVFFEHRRLYDLTGPVPDDPDYMVELGTASVITRGDDLTLVAWGWMRQEAEGAVAALAAEGISVELVDPRTIKPMDWATVLSSAARTGRLLVAEEAPVTGSVAAEILARATESLRLLAVARITMRDVIHPYSASMEAQVVPTAPDISAAARRLLERSRA